MLALDARRFGPRSVRKVFSPPLELQGRAGGLRLRAPGVDLSPAVLYFPPEPRAQVQRAGSVALCRWLDAFISQVPRRSTPVLLMDANAKFGTAANRRQEAAPVAGAWGREREGWQSAELGRVLAKHGMCLVNTCFAESSGHAWSNARTWSRID